MSNIQKFVEALPEVYQNIYGHAEYSEGNSRNCGERFECIERIIKAYQNYSGKRNLRILDLGCAQGFYSFSLAALDCTVDGIDFNEQNIDLCKELQSENGLSCSFRQDVITNDLIDQIKDDTYDVILIFSVIHHIAHEHGFEYARDLMTKLSAKAQFVLTELAVKEEPLYWNQNLPVQYSEWFKNIAFFDEQDFFSTHLSEYKRPLIFYSDKLCYLEDSYYSITGYKQSAYEGKPVDPEKRYYICDDHTILIKVFRNVMPFFKQEIRAEQEFLANNADLDFVPKLIRYEENEHRIMEITGIDYAALLSDLLKQDVKLDFTTIFRDLISECAELEKRNIYHNDLRPWNICVASSGHAFMIDFGATQSDVKDHVVCTMEKNGGRDHDHSVYETFVAMMYDCLQRNTYDTIKTASIYQMSFYYEFDRIPEEFAAFIKQFLLLDSSERSFQRISELYDLYVIKKEKCELSLEELIRLQEKQLTGLDVHKEESVKARETEHVLSERIEQLKGNLHESQNALQVALSERIEQLKGNLHESQSALQAVQRQVQELNAELELLNQRQVDINSRLDDDRRRLDLFSRRYDDLRGRLDLFSRRYDVFSRQYNELKGRLDLIDSWVVLRIWRKTSNIIKKKKK